MGAVLRRRWRALLRDHGRLIRQAALPPQSCRRGLPCVACQWRRAQRQAGDIPPRSRQRSRELLEGFSASRTSHWWQGCEVRVVAKHSSMY